MNTAIRGDGDVRKIVVILVGIVLVSLCFMSGCTENPSNNITEIDTDGDGFVDSLDAFPNDRTEWQDSDGDGVGDNADAFPHDPTETKDTDGDGVGDNADMFPLDPTEWQDSDGDGAGDNSDFFPFDPTQWEQPTADPFIEKALPYIEKLVRDDSDLYAYAYGLLSDFDSSSRECRLNAVYRDILMNYTCLPATLGSRPLQTPQQTMQAKQGTCEDLSILLGSLLINIGITSHLVFTDTHVYAIAHTVNKDVLWDCAEQSLIGHVETLFGEPMYQPIAQPLILPPAGVVYIGGELNKTFDGLIDYMTIVYSVQSDQPLHLFVVPTQREFYAFQVGDVANFTYDAHWQNVTSKTGTIPQMTTFGGIFLLNNNTESANTNIDFLFTFQPSFYRTYNKNALTVYDIVGKDYVILDPSLGDFGFPGYDAEVVGQKTMINTLTNQYYILS